MGSFEAPAPGDLGPKFRVLILYIGYPGGRSHHRIESVALQFIRVGSFVRQHGHRFCDRRGVIWNGLVAIGGANTALLEAGVLFSITILLTTGRGRVKRILGAFAEIRAVVPQRTSQAGRL